MSLKEFPELKDFDPQEHTWLQDVRWDEKNLVQAIVQDAEKHDVLMTAFMNPAALFLTVQRGEMVFWSRSRQEYWHKGATSGNTMRVESFALDCDGDALLFQVRMQGPQAACHTGRRSCFHRILAPGPVWQAEGELLFDPAQVYKS
ncbi:MAG: phosphoribosyl-AMP cyclohydrolase [Fibrobacter sp.]|nr:phosphoribosyl-AMP cyclohydrolase [Fibrobacter sp.]